MAEALRELFTVATARRTLERLGWAPDDAFLGALLADRRAGVRALGKRVQFLRAKAQAEREHMQQMLRLEEAQWNRGVGIVAGVDEVGRGPLAGPVVAAAVVVDRNVDLPGVDDSKRLSPARREVLFAEILSKCRAMGVGMVWQDVVDRENIRQATFMAMRKALGRLGCDPDIVFVDGERIPGLSLRQMGICRGDQQSLSIAAASVVAKVVRDRIMVVLDRKYPGYEFSRHKGYGTEAHREAIARLGLCPIHRRTFCGA
ncbi:MAG: ribonuclease HII [Candidatus Eisenbacteria sp.]|nr:ribonuclease HII [Candidatus Eisenbacteria bacterium]